MRDIPYANRPESRFLLVGLALVLVTGAAAGFALFRVVDPQPLALPLLAGMAFFGTNLGVRAWRM